jgi:hypothetical protein
MINSSVYFLNTLIKSHIGYQYEWIKWKVKAKYQVQYQVNRVIQLLI